MSKYNILGTLSIIIFCMSCSNGQSAAQTNSDAEGVMHPANN